MDWEKLLTEIGKNAGDLLEHVGKGAVAYTNQMKHIDFVNLDRNIALSKMQRNLHTMTTQEWDQYEQEFLQLSLGLIDWQQRIRAMELYAGMKMLEMDYYNCFRGFLTSGKALQ